MGFFGGKKKAAEQKKGEEAAPPPPQPSKPALESPAVAQAPKPDANAALKAETSVFEFGSAANNDDSKTLAGYCPVSDDMEPCRWELLPAGGNEAPQFRIIF
jgi:hypothetical protein